jgi:hypothetical protein
LSPRSWHHDGGVSVRGSPPVQPYDHHVEDGTGNEVSSFIRRCGLGRRIVVPHQPNHHPRQYRTPPASRLRDEDTGSRLRANEQSLHGRDRRLRSGGRREIVRSLAISVQAGERALPSHTTPQPLSTQTLATQTFVPHRCEKASNDVYRTRPIVGKIYKIYKKLDHDHKDDLNSTRNGDCGDPTLAIRMVA